MTNKQLLKCSYMMIRNKVNECTNNKDIVILVTNHLLSQCVQSKSLEMFGHIVKQPYASYPLIGFKYDEENDQFYAFHDYPNKPNSIKQFKLSKSDIKNLKIYKSEELIKWCKTGVGQNHDFIILFQGWQDWNKIIKEAIDREFSYILRNFTDLTQYIDIKLPVYWLKDYPNISIDDLYKIYLAYKKAYDNYAEYVINCTDSYFAELRKLLADMKY